MDGSGGIRPIAPAVKLIKSVSKILLDPSGKQIDKASTNIPVDGSMQKKDGLAIKNDDVFEKFPSTESLLPLKILSNPLLMRSEWAWKRLLITAMEAMETKGFQQANTAESSEAVKPASDTIVSSSADLPGKSLESGKVQVPVMAENMAPTAQVTPKYEAAIKLLWSILTNVSDGNGHDSWRTEVQNFHPKDSLIQFSQLQNEDMKHFSPVAKHWLVEDRLTSSVQVDSYERIGQGLFIPPNQGGKLKQIAHRYHARKQTRITGRGKLVHRIQFDFRVNEKPVRCTITSAKPSLLVHFDTNNPLLRAHLETGQELISNTLKNQGWQLEQWSVSSLEGDTEGGR